MPRREEKDEKVKLKNGIFAKARYENFFLCIGGKFLAIENATTNGNFLEIEIKLKANARNEEEKSNQ